MHDLQALLEDLANKDGKAPSPPVPPGMECYMVGDCHVLAVALHRHFGWGIGVVLNDDAWFWEDPRDPDNGIPEVIHAYAIDPQGIAWDIRGARPAQDMVRDCAEYFLMEEGSLSTDWMKGERELETYVGEGVDEDGNAFERPLGTYTDQDVARALEDALRSLFRHPGWPQRTPSPRPPGR